MTHDPHHPLIRRALFALARPLARLAASQRLSLTELKRLIESAYYAELRQRDLTVRETCELLEISPSKAALLAQSLRQALLHAAPSVDALDADVRLRVTSPSGEGRTALRYPIRHGSDTVWLSEPEVAERYRRRLDTQSAESARIEAVIASGADAIGRTSGVWLFVAIVPEAPIHGRLDKATVERIDRWQRSNVPTSPLGRTLPAHGRGIPAPGRVVFTGSLFSSEEDETDVRDALVELYIDGGAFAAVPIGLRTTGEEDARQVGEITLVDDGILLMDLALRWCAAEAGAWGTARVVMGFIDADGPDGVLGRPIELVQSDTGTVHRIRPSRTVAGRVRSETVADLSVTLTVQQRLSVLHQSLAGLLHWFGLPEPAQILADGSIVPRQFTMPRYREAEAWATANGVGAEGLRTT